MAGAREAVVLVHGIWMPGTDLLMLGERLRRTGFRAAVFRYRSVFRTPAENGKRLARFAAHLGAERVHYVGHSLGGIVLLHRFAVGDAPPPGRIVLLGSPVRGTDSARRLAEGRGWRILFGRSFDRGLLGGAPAPPDDREIGVVAGSRPIGLGRLFGPLPEPNDGTVTVADTRFSGARDQVVAPVTHSGLLVSRAVARYVISFLRCGRFHPSDRTFED